MPVPDDEQIAPGRTRNVTRWQEERRRWAHLPDATPPPLTWACEHEERIPVGPRELVLRAIRAPSDGVLMASIGIEPGSTPLTLSAARCGLLQRRVRELREAIVADEARRRREAAAPPAAEGSEP